jgi:prepilin-type N-terminal cleavage/methylation domain-containing protein
MQAKLNPPEDAVRGRPGAFTLIEVMVAMTIIAVVFVSVFSGMGMGLSVTQLSRENLRATQIMLDKMEGVRLYNWVQLNNTNFLIASFTNSFYETNNVGQVTAQGNGVNYTGTVAVAACPISASYSTNMRQVTVTVGWTSGNIARSRSMSTFVSMMGLQNYVFNN